MKKTIRLTESELYSLVKKIINEQIGTGVDNLSDTEKDLYGKMTDMMADNNPRTTTTGDKLNAQDQKRQREISNKKQIELERERKKKQEEEKRQSYKLEFKKIRENQIKMKTPMKSIFQNGQNMGGVKLIDDNQFLFRGPKPNYDNFTVFQDLGYSVNGNKFKLVRRSSEFARLLDGGSEFNDVRNTIKILEEMIRRKTANKSGETYVLKSKDGSSDLKVKPSYFLAGSQVNIKTDDNGMIEDEWFVPTFNNRTPLI